jgi:hypothetical protein
MRMPHGVHGDGSELIETVVLVDYWLAALPAAEEDAVEQHLMACDACGDRLCEVMALAEGLRGLARSGSLQVIVDDTLVRRAEGVSFNTGSSAACSPSPRSQQPTLPILRAEEQQGSASAPRSSGLRRYNHRLIAPHARHPPRSLRNPLGPGAGGMGEV